MELENLMSAFAEKLGIEGVEFVSKAEEWRDTMENFRPAAEEAAVRDQEAAQFTKFGGNGPGFLSV